MSGSIPAKSLFQHNVSFHDLTSFRVGRADRRALGDRWMGQQHRFYFGAGNLYPAEMIISSERA